MAAFTVSRWLLHHPMVVLVGMLQEHFCWCTADVLNMDQKVVLVVLHCLEYIENNNNNNDHNKMKMQRNSEKNRSGVSRPLRTSTPGLWL